MVLSSFVKRIHINFVLAFLILGEGGQNELLSFKKTAGVAAIVYIRTFVRKHPSLL